MIEQRVSFRYAKAIIETAEDEKLTDLLFKDFMYVREVCNASHELKVLIKSPVVNARKKNKVIDAIFQDKIDPVTLNFLKFLIDKERGELILDVIEQYEDLYNKLNNKIKVEITSVIDLSDDIKKEIIDKISENTKMEVLPTFKVKSDVKGGLLVKINDWVYDATLKSQLENLYKTLSKN